MKKARVEKTNQGFSPSSHTLNVKTTMFATSVPGQNGSCQPISSPARSRNAPSCYCPADKQAGNRDLSTALYLHFSLLLTRLELIWWPQGLLIPSSHPLSDSVTLFPPHLQVIQPNHILPCPGELLHPSLSSARANSSSLPQFPFAVVPNTCFRRDKFGINPLFYLQWKKPSPAWFVVCCMQRLLRNTVFPKIRNNNNNKNNHTTKTTSCSMHCRFLSDLIFSKPSQPCQLSSIFFWHVCLGLFISQGSSLPFSSFHVLFLFLFCISSTFWSVTILNTRNGNWINQQHILSSYPPL